MRIHVFLAVGWQGMKHQDIDLEATLGDVAGTIGIHSSSRCKPLVSLSCNDDDDDDDGGSRGPSHGLEQAGSQKMAASQNRDSEGCEWGAGAAIQVSF